MKIVEFRHDPIYEFHFLNAGSRMGQFYEDRLPVHVGKVDWLPENLSALVVTGDLQGRERFNDSDGGPLRLLGEVLPDRLVDELFPLVGLSSSDRVGALLAGDFYTVPALDRRGGTGDVTEVWLAFGRCFHWVAGVPGNHDLFGEKGKRPRFPAHLHYLDGDLVSLDGLKIAGLGGIIGSPDRNQRRSESDYLCLLSFLVEACPDLILMHDGPAGSHPDQRGQFSVLECLLNDYQGLVVRGHAHWDQPIAEFDQGMQILNVDAHVVLLTR